MDPSTIPTGVPVVFQAARHAKNLHNPYGTTGAVCWFDNRDEAEQVTLHARDGKVAIQALRTERYLRVDDAGTCLFDGKTIGISTLFTVHTDPLFQLRIVSCHTGGSLQCTNKGIVKCGSLTGDAGWRMIVPQQVKSANRRRCTTSTSTTVSARSRDLVGKERRDFVLDLAKCGKSADEIEQLVAHLFDVPEPAPEPAPEPMVDQWSRRDMPPPLLSDCPASPVSPKSPISPLPPM